MIALKKYNLSNLQYIIKHNIIIIVNKNIFHILSFLLLTKFELELIA